MYQESSVTEREIQVMLEFKWGLLKTRNTIKSAMMYGLIELDKQE